MNAKIVFQRAMLLPDKITLVVKIAEPDIWTGELRLTNGIKDMSEKRKKMLKDMLIKCSEFITEVYEL